jgi:hypothetical protein
MNQSLSPRSRRGPSAWWWVTLLLVVVVVLWAVWGWGGRGVADMPAPPVQDVGALELPLVPVRHGMPPEIARPRPVFALHVTEVKVSHQGEPRFPVV